MRSIATAFLALSWALSAIPAEGSSPLDALRRRAPAEYVPGEVIVKFREGAGSGARSMAVQSGGGKLRRALSRRTRHEKVKLADGVAVEEAIRELNRDPAVEYAQPNYVYRTTALPNDPDFSKLWGLKNTGQYVSGGSYTRNNPGTSGKHMSLESAWNVITDCSSVVVAVVDSGVNYNHGDLSANMWNGGATYPNHGYDFVNDDNDPMDLNGHGTHVAGTIGAVGNNATGATGVCWNVKLMAVRVMDALGNGTTADIIQGIDFAVTQGAKVINMSLGGGGAYDPSFSAAIDDAQAADVVVVVAAGNETSDNDKSATYPCNFSQSNLICVAALDQAYGLASFSNYGKTSVDVGAPGTNVLSSYYGSESILQLGLTTGFWTNVSGWSIAQKTLPIDGKSKTLDMLTSPTNFNNTTASYSNNLDARVYRSMNMSANAVTMAIFMMGSVASGDSLKIACKATSGDPFTGGTVVKTLSNFAIGSSSDDYDELTLEIPAACQNASGSFGFQLQTDASGTSRGIAVIEIDRIDHTFSNTAKAVLDGTSMASPHVAGLAAMLRARNPSYAATDVIDAIKWSGPVVQDLCGITTTSRAADAFAALSYIRAPGGLSATAQ